ncbi:MAG TPA: MlaD family protein [Thermodesulfobacteriota bacterium]|nr:MlaD family protein [Thermodesulfobacteriota bacterium]
MEKKGLGIEVKVGIFVFIGLVVLGYMTFRINKYKFKTAGGYEVTALFDSVSGLVKDSPVQIAGVEVGRIERIGLKDGQAEVTMNIRKDVPIYADAKAVIKSQGVLGDKFIEIMPGKEKDKRMASGGMIQKSRSTIELDDILAQAEPAIQNIRSVTKSLDEVLGSEEGKANLKETFFNIRKTTEDIRSIALGLSHGEGTMGKLIRDDALYKDMRATVSGLKETVIQVQEGKGSVGKFVKDDQFYESTKQAVDSLQRVAQKIDSGEGTLGKLVNDDSLYKEAKATMANLNQATEKLNNGQGSLGKLMSDDSLYKEAKYTLRSVTRATEGLQEQVPVSILSTIIGTIIK